MMVACEKVFLLLGYLYQIRGVVTSGKDPDNAGFVYLCDPRVGFFILPPTMTCGAITSGEEPDCLGTFYFKLSN